MGTSFLSLQKHSSSPIICTGFSTGYNNLPIPVQVRILLPECETNFQDSRYRVSVSRITFVLPTQVQNKIMPYYTFLLIAPNNQMSKFIIYEKDNNQNIIYGIIPSTFLIPCNSSSSHSMGIKTLNAPQLFLHRRKHSSCGNKNS